jgi:hypothetical protein
MQVGHPPAARTPLRGRFSLAPVLAWTGAACVFIALLTTEHFLPWVTWHSEAVVFAGVAIVSLAALASRQPGTAEGPIGVPSVVLPFAALFALALVQWSLGILTFGGDAVAIGLYVALAVLCAASGYTVAPPTADGTARAHACAGALAWTWLAAGLLSCVIALAQAFDVWTHAGWILRMPDLRRPGGNVGQPNHLASILVLAYASGLYLLARKRIQPLALGLLGGMLAIGLGATESRMGALALAVLLGWWAWRRPAVAPHAPARLTWMLAVPAALLFAGWPSVLKLADLLGVDAAHRFTYGTSRPELWLQLLGASWQHPLAGWGMLEVAEAHNAVAHAYGNGYPLSYAHLLPLDIALWVGWPAAVVLCGAALVWLWRRLRPVPDALAWFALAVLLVLGVHSMLEFPFAYSYFLAPCVFLLGMVQGARGDRSVVTMPRRAGLAACAAFTALLAWSAVEYVAIEEDFRVVRFETLRIGRTANEHRTPDVVLFTQLGTLLTGSRIEPRPGMPPQEMADLRKLALRYPWVSTQYRYAVALALNGQQAEAARQLQIVRGQRGDPLYQAIKRELAGLASTRFPELAGFTLP